MMVTLRRVRIPLRAERIVVCEGNIYSDWTIKQQNAIVCNNRIIRYDARGTGRLRFSLTGLLITSRCCQALAFFFLLLC